MNYHLTPKSGNAKTGPMPVTIASSETCPTACPLNNGGCYAKHSFLGMHWRKVTSGKAGTAFKDFANSVSELPADIWRYGQAGDLPGKGNRIDATKLMQLVAANNSRPVIAYTHKPVLGKSQVAKHNRKALKLAASRGFLVNLSANSLEHADQLMSLGLAPVCVVLPADHKGTTTTPKGHPVIVCPAVISDTNCKTCKICSKKRTAIVGFPAHGSGKKKASEVTAQITT